MNYSKKQMQPLITKYGIDVESDARFCEIVEMFDGQPNYQLWAVKMVFSNALEIETLRQIQEWASNNQTSIKLLRLKNIVAYSTKTLISQLQREIRGLNMLNFIKENISKFNTLQRQMLNEALDIKNQDGLTATTDTNIRNWHQNFVKFSRLPKTRQQKFISTASAFRDVNALLQSITDACKQSYEWTKDDMLAYMENNASDCKVVWENGDIVIINVPSFQSSHNMCGSGRTGWCITRENDYFKSYVTNHSRRRQFFYFNFGLNEKDELAHIGFTVEAGTGITNAHSTSNMDMTGCGIEYNGKRVSVNDVLSKHKIPMETFIQLSRNTFFKEWTVDSILASLARRRACRVAYNKDGRLILEITNYTLLRTLASNTYLPLNNYQSINGENAPKIFLLFDTNVKECGEKSVILMEFRKDIYNIYSLVNVFDAFGSNIKEQNYLNKIGISTQDYFPRNDVNNDMLLHKLINENDEDGAIDLIRKNSDTINVNAECNGTTPVFSAIDKQMYRLFGEIISHKTFDSSSVNSYEETLLGSLLYSYVTEDEVDKDELRKMINTVCDSETYDFNTQNINLDSPINIACEYPSLLWVVEKLAAKPQVSVNIVNDVDRAALASALRTRNIDAARIIGTRPDLVITDFDRELAKKNDINLDEIIRPSAKPSFVEDAADKLVKALAAAYKH